MTHITVEYMVVPGRLKVCADCESVEGIFAFLGQVSDIFRHDTCGCCGSKEVRFGHRVAQGYDFYEARCAQCNATLGFGQRRDGTGLFPKTKDEHGNPLPDGGWSVYVPQGRH